MSVSIVKLPINRYCHETVPLEIIECNDPITVKSVRAGGNIEEIQLFKYTVVDSFFNRGELIKWHTHIGYKTGDRINLRNFLVRNFRGITQLVIVDKTEIKLLGDSYD